MNATYWYRTTHQEPTGPHSYADLIALRDKGVITPETLVSCDGKQYLSVEIALGSDFFRKAPLDTPPDSDNDASDPKGRPPEDRSFLSVASSFVTFSVRSIAHTAMLLTIWLTTFEWDIPNMKRAVSNGSNNDCRLYMLKKWYLGAVAMTVVAAFAWVVLLRMKQNNTLSGERLEWVYSIMALIAFLYPVTLTLAFVLGLIGDLFWSLGGMR